MRTIFFDCPKCHAGLTVVQTEWLMAQVQKDQAQIAALREALEAIKTAINDEEDGSGSYWPARKFLDDRGIYNGDLNDLRVLYAVTKTALGKQGE